MQRCCSCRVLCVDIGSQCDKEINNLMRVAKTSPMQRRTRIRVTHIDVAEETFILVSKQNQRQRLVTLSRKMQYAQIFLIWKTWICPPAHEHLNEVPITMVSGKMYGPGTIILLVTRSQSCEKNIRTTWNTTLLRLYFGIYQYIFNLYFSTYSSLFPPLLSQALNNSQSWRFWSLVYPFFQ